MINLQMLILYIPACLALNMILGPNNVLSISIGSQQGIPAAAWAYIGRLIAFSMLIGLTALGLGQLLASSEQVFSLIKWVGVLYLLWVGIQLLRQKSTTTEQDQVQDQPIATLIKKDFIIAIANPKAILIFTAFFPQFIRVKYYWTDFLTLGVVFLILEFFAVLAYAILGHKLVKILKSNNLGIISKISGSLMIFFAMALALMKKPT